MIRTLKNFNHLIGAFFAGLYYRFPGKKLILIGVTGTDGKTTTTNLIYHILHENGLPVAMISTVSAKIKGEDLDTGFHVTSPAPWALNKFLKKMVQAKMKYAVIEVTSHGLDQNRLFPLHFHISVLTNITHEHLDYHKTPEKYLEAKSKLFLSSDLAVLNKDDSSYKPMHRILENQTVVLAYSYAQTKKYISPLPGDYNNQNVLAAATVAEQLGIDSKQIQKALNTFKGIPGRLEEIKMGQPFEVIVDFAHTPNAIEQLLKMLHARLRKKGELWIVFGSAGLRDHTKRPKMGKAASQYAHHIVLTAEDPRTEDATHIAEEIAKGIPHKDKYHIEIDRSKAIRYALDRAQKDDIVVITGKGHERSMSFGKKEYPWSDQSETKKILGEMGFEKKG